MDSGSRGYKDIMLSYCAVRDSSIADVLTMRSLPHRADAGVNRRLRADLPVRVGPKKLNPTLSLLNQNQ